jgi:hypothetical protein
MTVTVSAISPAIAALVAAAKTAYNTAKVDVLEGPPVTALDDTYSQRVWIGYNPLNPEEPSATGDQEFATLGARSRNEDFTVVCCCEYWTGDPTPSTARLGAFALLSAFEPLLRGTPGSGGPGDATLGRVVLWSQIAGGIDYAAEQSSNGVVGRVVFHVTCRARLTS